MFFSQNVYKNIFNTQVLNFFWNHETNCYRMALQKYDLGFQIQTDLGANFA